jgi:dihydroxyacid dehydratase/phosphogluconate dehydratase
MPEMFTPIQHVNANRTLKKLTIMITDGRYSGVSHGAAVGHLTPEAKRGGGILYLQTGDILQTNLRGRSILLLDREALRESGAIIASNEELAKTRRALGQERLRRIEQRLNIIAPTNRMRDVTDAARGVLPLAVAECATESFAEFAGRHLALAGD